MDESYNDKTITKKYKSRWYIKAILNGQIIEEYENDYPYPSCLIFGTTLNKKVLHIVCGTNENEVWIITAYYPDSMEWNSDFKTRKEKK